MGTLLGERLCRLSCVTSEYAPCLFFFTLCYPRDVKGFKQPSSCLRKEEVLKGMFTIRSAWSTHRSCKLGSHCPGWRGGRERQQQQ